MKYRMLLVYPLESGKYLIIGGNMRYRAMLDLDFKTAPCVIIPKRDLYRETESLHYPRQLRLR